MRRAPLLAFLIVALIARLVPVTASAGENASWPSDRLVPAAPARFVVKYRGTVDACAHCLLKARVPFATLTGSTSLDRLHRELGVRAARALFFDDHTIKGGRTAAYRMHVAEIQQRFRGRTARALSPVAGPNLSGIYVLELAPGTDVAAAAARYAADPSVEYAHPDYTMRAALTPNDPYFASTGTWGQPYPDLWGLHVMQATTAWDTARGEGAVIAVIDSGVDPAHPDIAANLWSNPGEIPNNGIDDDDNGFVDDTHGWDFVDDDNAPTDLNGHGTHVAGIAAAVGNNGVGVVGVAFGARIMPVRGLDPQGNGVVSDLAQAIGYAAENGADVLNNSWGGAISNAAFGIPDALSDAIAAATSLGAVVVAAAGNSRASVDFFEPAAIPQAIAVGATDASDAYAVFSNFGTALSVSAPGVDVLSLRSAVSPVTEFGQPLGQGYLRLSGTSMASPHAAGLAAVLLSASPGLTPDEVRWHLELSADQPGFPGFEGQPWNPYFGWGRLNAARVFDTPPVTTRLRSQPIDLHAFPNSIVPDVASIGLKFTTTGPVAWTVSAPSWLPASPASGSSATTIGLALDTTGLGAGSQSGPVVVSAPGAVDGGDSVSASLHTHRDERLGSPVLVSSTYRDFMGPPTPPSMISDGQGALLAWGGISQRALFVARVDGNVLGGPFALDAASGTYKEQVTLGFDGVNYLALWKDTTEVSTNPYRAIKTVRALRVSPAGVALDPTSIELGSVVDRGYLGIFPIGVGFDGKEYTVFWTELNLRTDRSKVFVKRVGRDGISTKRRKIYPQRRTKVGSHASGIQPRIACSAGSCLLVWADVDGTNSLGAFGRSLYGVRLVGEKVIDEAPVKLLAGADLLTGVATDGNGFFVLADRLVVCPGPSLCGEDVVGARVTDNLVTLDANGILLDNGGSTRSAAFPRSSGLTFDGSNFVATFIGDGPNGAIQIFATRVAADGHVLDDEAEGLLVHVGEVGPYRALRSTITATATDCIVAWGDTVFQQPEDFSTITNPIFVQHVLAH